MIDELNRMDANVEYYDPYIKEYKRNGKMYYSIGSINEKVISEYDLIIVTTAHTTVDYEMIQKNAQFIFDTKNALVAIKNRGNIEVL